MFITYLLSVSGDCPNFEYGNVSCDLFIHPSESRWIVPGTFDIDD